MGSTPRWRSGAGVYIKRTITREVICRVCGPVEDGFIRYRDAAKALRDHEREHAAAAPTEEKPHGE